MAQKTLRDSMGTRKGSLSSPRTSQTAFRIPCNTEIFILNIPKEQRQVPAWQFLPSSVQITVFIAKAHASSLEHPNFSSMQERKILAHTKAILESSFLKSQT